MRTGFVAARKDAVMRIFERARQRGEIAEDVDVDTVWYVAPALFFFRTTLLAEPVDQAFARHVVDDIVLPLLRPGEPT
jgi:hypothetical protein